MSVGTAKKSMATVEPRWFSRNVRQVCEGGVRRRGISREIVRSDTEMMFNRRWYFKLALEFSDQAPRHRSAVVLQKREVGWDTPRRAAAVLVSSLFAVALL